MRWGDDYVKRHSLASLRLLGSVGEPINPEAWMWYHTVVGKKRCPIVDTWWQTETGAIMVTPLPGVTPTKPGSCAVPFFGVVPKVLDEQGNDVPKGSGGRLFLAKPWPSMLRTLWGDDARFKKQYWTELKGYYFAGDGARFDKDGYSLGGRPDRRRAERLGAPYRHGRGRERHGGPSGGGGGRRCWAAGRP